MGCCGDKRARMAKALEEKNLGIVSLAKAMIGPPAAPRLVTERLNRCRACVEIDSRGERLYRQIGDVFYCGQPRLENIYRDERKDGCGCELGLKASRRDVGCPRNHWAILMLQAPAGLVTHTGAMRPDAKTNPGANIKPIDNSPKNS